MVDQDANLCSVLRGAQKRADGVAPDFDNVFAMARERAGRRYGKRVARLVAAAAVAMLALSLLMPADSEMRYVDVDELMGSTTWSAPSDALLPEYEFDIYREVPTLFESTDPDGGTLL